MSVTALLKYLETDIKKISFVDVVWITFHNEPKASVTRCKAVQSLNQAEGIPS